MDKKIWLITGVSGGMGKALAEEAMGRGEYVIGTFREKKQAEKFSNSHPKNGKGVVLDVTDFEMIKHVVSEVIDKYGHIDVLVNNAGVGFAGAIEEASMEEMKGVFAANYFGIFALIKEVLPGMRFRKSGHVVQISSHAGVKAFAGFGVYNASKFALEGMSEALAQELKPLGIGMTIVEPGPFRTNFAGKSLQIAQLEIADYASTAGTFKNKLLSADGNQEGNPEKAAMIIYDHIHEAEPTLRLPLGIIPIQTIGMKIRSLEDDLSSCLSKAKSAIYND